MNKKVSDRHAMGIKPVKQKKTCAKEWNRLGDKKSLVQEQVKTYESNAGKQYESKTNGGKRVGEKGKKLRDSVITTVDTDAV